MRKIKLLFILLLAVITLGVFQAQKLDASSPLEILTRSGSNVYHYDSTDPVMIPTTYAEQTHEFRGVWVATVFSLNMPLHTSETQYKAAYNELLDRVIAKNMNAILFQVRPQNDAFYESDYAEFSKWLTGTEGVDPGWDVMEYMVTRAHERGVEFHAWLNPYRVGNSTLSKTNFISTLHPGNFASLNPDLVVGGNPDGNGLIPYILNPGEPVVKEYIRDVVKELITLYDVDGVHFDDYFYPYSGISSDSATYDAYKLSGQTLANWRRENVNDVVRGVKEDVDLHNDTNSKDVRFGISPFGIWAGKNTMPDGSNTGATAQSYVSQYADSKKWVEQGWVHYINPQIYWNFKHSTAPYADVVDWWASVVRGTDVDLLIGHSIANAAGWLSDEIATQLKYNQKHPEIKGSVMYSAAFLNGTNMTEVVNNYWQNDPLGTWATSNVEKPTYQLSGTYSNGAYRSDVTVTLTSTDQAYYKIGGGEWTIYTAPVVLTHQGLETFYMKAINNLDEESLISAVDIQITRINSVLPIITVSGTQIGLSYVLGSTVTVTSSSNTIWIAVNKGSVGAWNPYSEPLVLNETGTYFIRTKTIDSLGIESSEVTRTISVVAETYPNPVLNITGSGTDPYYKNLTFTLTSTAPSYSYKINDGAWTVYTEPISLTTDGTYIISYRNNDGASIVTTKTVYIDNIEPDDPTISIVGEFDGWYYTNETSVTLTPSNPNDKIMYKIHNGSVWSSWLVYSEVLEFVLNATYTVEYYAIDRAGNVSETLDQRIRLNMPLSEDNLYVIRNGKIINYYNTNNPILLPTSYTEKSEEVRAVWVATVANIDIPLHTSEADYKGRIIVMLDRLEANNFNTMFFQVRPMNDAFYESDYAPFSRYLTGIEGVDPGWDVLGFIIEEAHKRGIEFHAWLNPYRVSNNGDLTKAQQLALLHDDNFAKQNPHLVLEDKGGKLILNPGENQVRTYIKNVIQELMAKYDVDGIHFDDYFYSYSGMEDIQDAQTYNNTKDTGQTLADWRRNNIDLLMEDLFYTIETWNVVQEKNVKFGISPFGIWLSGGEEGSNTSPYALQSYKDQFADSKKWVENGWVHYILPQLYWQFDHSAAPFADLVDWWADLTQANGVGLIIGQGFYRYTEGTWTDDNELIEQIRYISTKESVIGVSLFSYKTLLSPNAKVTQTLDRLNTIYWTTYPGFPWESDVKKVEEPITCEIGEILVDGNCVPEPITCEIGYELVDGECILIPIENCEDGYEFIDGECVLIEVPSEGLSTPVIVAIAAGSSLALLGIIALIVKKLVIRI
ncbi:MAG: family 10 glycosylhydrolase [Acholeplasmataceae bacterium]|nr:family 10 glycosylhydrolase [Acholeplasmataceae bacterium]